MNWTVEPGRGPGDVQRLGQVNCLAKGALMKLPFEQTASSEAKRASHFRLISASLVHVTAVAAS